MFGFTVMVKVNRVGALMHIHGVMEIGEAARYAGKANARLSGHPKPMIIANVAAGLATAAPLLIFGMAQAAFDWPAWLWMPALLLAVIFGFWAGPASCRKYVVENYRKNLGARGLAESFSSTFTISDEAFISSIGRITTRADWMAVSDIIQTDRYWILLIEGQASFLPRRFFPSQADEKAFLSAILERMSPGARARSSDVVKFVSH